MPAPTTLTPLSKAIWMRHLLKPRLAPSLLGLVVALPLACQVQAQEISFQIPAQSLTSALQAFGQQSKLQVLYSPDQLKGLKSIAVRGSMEPTVALQKLLGSSGVAYGVSGNTITITGRSEGGALELGATSVTGQQLGETTEGTGSYTTASMSTATKLATSMRETPQSVTVTPWAA